MYHHSSGPPPLPLGTGVAHCGLGLPSPDCSLVNNQDNPPQTCPPSTLIKTISQWRLSSQVILGCGKVTSVTNGLSRLYLYVFFITADINCQELLNYVWDCMGPSPSHTGTLAGLILYKPCAYSHSLVSSWVKWP